MTWGSITKVCAAEKHPDDSVEILWLPAWRAWAFVFGIQVVTGTENANLVVSEERGRVGSHRFGSRSREPTAVLCTTVT